MAQMCCLDTRRCVAWIRADVLPGYAQKYCLAECLKGWSFAVSEAQVVAAAASPLHAVLPLPESIDLLKSNSFVLLIHTDAVVL